MSPIKKALEEFSDDRRYHPLSSETSHHKLLNYGMTRLVHLDPASAEIARITDWSEYGIDEEATKIVKIINQNIAENIQ